MDVTTIIDIDVWSPNHQSFNFSIHDLICSLAFTVGTENGVLRVWRNTKYERKRPWFVLVPVLTAYASIHSGKWVIAIYRKSNALSLLNSAQINYINTTLFILLRIFE